MVNVTPFMRFFFYALFGLVTEIGTSAVRDLVDSITHELKKIERYNMKNIFLAVKGGWKNSSKLNGDVSLLMAPVYGLGILFLFEPLYFLIQNFEAWHRFLIWAIGFTGIEVVSGFFYTKVLGHCPWDYRDYPDVLLGFSRFGLFPYWGLCGLIVEAYVCYMLGM